LVRLPGARGWTRRTTARLPWRHQALQTQQPCARRHPQLLGRCHCRAWRSQARESLLRLPRMGKGWAYGPVAWARRLAWLLLMARELEFLPVEDVALRWLLAREPLWGRASGHLLVEAPWWLLAPLMVKGWVCGWGALLCQPAWQPLLVSAWEHQQPAEVLWQWLLACLLLPA